MRTCVCQTRTRRERPMQPKPGDLPQQQPCQRLAEPFNRRSAAQSVFGQPAAAAARAGRLHAAPLHADLGCLGQARAARPVHHLEPLVHLVALGLGPRLAHVHGDLARRPPHVVQARGLGDAGVPAEARVARPQCPAVAARLRGAALAPRPAARRGVAPPARLRSPQRRAPQARGASAHAGRGTSRRARTCTRRRRSTAARCSTGSCSFATLGQVRAAPGSSTALGLRATADAVRGGGAHAAGPRLQQLELALLSFAGVAPLAVLVEDGAAPSLDQRLGRAAVGRGLVRQLAQEEHHLARVSRVRRARARAATTAPGMPRQRRTLCSVRGGSCQRPPACTRALAPAAGARARRRAPCPRRSA